MEIIDKKFIVIEGLYGSGQSTQVNLLNDFFLEKGLSVLKTKEPTLTSEAGKKIKKILEKEEKISFKELQILFTEDRKEHLEKEIIPALEKGMIVISDRYYFSSFAYGSASGLSLDWLINLNKDFLEPDITFFLDVSPQTSIERIYKRGSKVTLFEEKERFKKVYKNYKLLLERFEKMKRIDGEKSIEEVFSQIKSFLKI